MINQPGSLLSIDICARPFGTARRLLIYNMVTSNGNSGTSVYGTVEGHGIDGSVVLDAEEPQLRKNNDDLKRIRYGLEDGYQRLAIVLTRHQLLAEILLYFPKRSHGRSKSGSFVSFAVSCVNAYAKLKATCSTFNAPRMKDQL